MPCRWDARLRHSRRQPPPGPRRGRPGSPHACPWAVNTFSKLQRALPARPRSCSAFSLVRTEEIAGSHQRHRDVFCLPLKISRARIAGEPTLCPSPRGLCPHSCPSAPAVAVPWPEWLLTQLAKCKGRDVLRCLDLSTSNIPQMNFSPSLALEKCRHLSSDPVLKLWLLRILFPLPKKIRALSRTGCAGRFPARSSPDAPAEQGELSPTLLVLTPPP